MNIPLGKIRDGIFWSFINADNALRTSEELHFKCNYQFSIPLSTISLEESLKGQILTHKLIKKQSISEGEWNEITTHKSKLTKSSLQLLERLNKISNKKFEEYLSNYVKEGFIPRARTKAELTSELKKDGEIYPKFQVLRERCFYADWNKSKQNWQSLLKFSEDEQEALSNFVLSSAAIELRHLCYSIEVVVNGYRKAGTVLHKIPFPSYSEYRKPADYESIQEILDIQKKIIDNKKLLDKGFKIFRKFTSN